jgi:NADPH:quinone reductase-like Zn-dependent oxidoreductase
LVISVGANTLGPTSQERTFVMTRKVVFDEVGGPEVLRVDDVTVGEPGPGEVRIRVEAIGLNRAEAMYRAGEYIYAPSFPSAGLGYEAAGTVDAVGEGVTGLAPGDPVATIPGFLMNRYGAYGEQVLMPAGSVVRRPEGIDAVTASAVWMAYTTAYGMLVETGRIRAGDHVLVTGASSGVGLAAIQVANYLGAIPIATTRTAAKKERLHKAGAVDVIVTGEEDLADAVRARTDGRGVRIAVDAITGPGVHRVAAAVEPGGDIVLYGFLDPGPIMYPLAGDFRNRPVHWYSFFELTMEKPDQLRRARHFIDAGLRAGALDPVIDRTFELNDVVEAHRYLESNAQFGKIVLTVDR